MSSITKALFQKAPLHWGVTEDSRRLGASTQTWLQVISVERFLFENEIDFIPSLQNKLRRKFKFQDLRKFQGMRTRESRRTYKYAADSSDETTTKSSKVMILKNEDFCWVDMTVVHRFRLQTLQLQKIV